MVVTTRVSLPEKNHIIETFRIECCTMKFFCLDWVCGGQWNKMEQFLCNFSSVVQNSKLDLVVFLNGSLETERLNEWCKRQQQAYKFLQEIHQHVNLKRKPPPKLWWIPPAFLRSAIRLAFRSLNMKIVRGSQPALPYSIRNSRQTHSHVFLVPLLFIRCARWKVRIGKINSRILKKQFKGIWPGLQIITRILSGLWRSTISTESLEMRQSILCTNLSASSLLKSWN